MSFSENTAAQIVAGVVLAAILGMAGALRGLFGGRVKHFLKSRLGTLDKISSYFILESQRKNACGVYQQGIRPMLPLVDILYLEYAHYLLRRDVLSTLYVFPNKDGSYRPQELAEFKQFRDRVFLILKDCAGRVRVVAPSQIPGEPNADVRTVGQNAGVLFSDEFREDLEYMGSKSFRDDAKRLTGRSIRGLYDFSGGHPPERQLATIFDHISDSRMVWEFLAARAPLEEKALCFVIWEREFDKLGVFVRLASRLKANNLSLVVGKTVYADGLRRRPVPVFEPTKTVCLFDDTITLIEKLGAKSEFEAQQYVRLLWAILVDVHMCERVSMSKSVKEGTVLFNLATAGLRHRPAHIARSAYAVLYLVNKLREEYDHH